MDVGVETPDPTDFPITSPVEKVTQDVAKLTWPWPKGTCHVTVMESEGTLSGHSK